MTANQVNDTQQIIDTDKALTVTASDILDVLALIEEEKASGKNSRAEADNHGETLLSLVQDQVATFGTPVDVIFSEVYRAGDYSEEKRGIDEDGNEYRNKVERMNGKAPATLQQYRTRIETVAKHTDITTIKAYTERKDSGKEKFVSAMSQVRKIYTELTADADKVQLQDAIKKINAAFKDGKESERADILKEVTSLAMKIAASE